MRMMVALAWCLALVATRGWTAERTDPQTRITAVTQLAIQVGQGDVQAALAMGPALQDADPKVSAAARKGVESLPAQVIETLLTVARGENPDTRRRALLVLSGVHGFADRHLKASCCFIAPLLAGLEDRDPSVRAAAHWALQRTHDWHSDYGVLEQLRLVFGQGLMPITGNAFCPRETLLRVAGWPQDANPAAQVLAGLTAPDPYVRRWHAWLAGWMDLPAAIPQLQTMLTDDNPLVRLGAAEGLGQMLDPRVIRPLVTALADTDPDVRRQVVMALGTVRACAVAYQQCAPYWHTSDDIVTHAKAREAELIAAKAGEALLPWLQDTDPAMRAAAANALAGFPATFDVLSALLPLLTDPDPGVVRATVDALTRVPDARAVAPLLGILQAHPDMEYGVIHTFSLTADQAVPTLIALLNAPDTHVRQTAVRMLARLTAQDFGTDAAKWQAWWETHGNHEPVGTERWFPL